MRRLIKRLTVFDAQTAPAYSVAIDVSDYEEIQFVHSTIASSDQVVKLQGAVALSDTTPAKPPTFSSAKAVDNEWDYVESFDLQDTTSAITGDTGVTFAGADVRQFTANVAALDYISFHVTTGTAGALNTKVALYSKS